MIASQAAILGSEMHMMDSRYTGRTYRITISLPLGYAAPAGEEWPFDDVPAVWPVVYVLDGNWYFGMVTDIIRPMAWCGGTTDAIVVGIGYAEDQDPIAAFRASFTQRDLDLAPTWDESIEKSESQRNRPSPQGDASNFRKFIKDELLPFVEKAYRTAPTRRILVGHSLGGLFALLSLFEMPDLFDTLIIGSPSLWYGNRIAFRQEKAFSKKHRKIPAKVYLYVGELEETSDDPRVTDVHYLADVMQSRQYEGFSVVKHVIPDQNHCEVIAPGIQAGLKFALKK